YNILELAVYGTAQEISGQLAALGGEILNDFDIFKSHRSDITDTSATTTALRRLAKEAANAKDMAFTVALRLRLTDRIKREFFEDELRKKFTSSHAKKLEWYLPRNLVKTTTSLYYKLLNLTTRLVELAQLEGFVLSATQNSRWTPTSNYWKLSADKYSTTTHHRNKVIMLGNFNTQLGDFNTRLGELTGDNYDYPAWKQDSFKTLSAAQSLILFWYQQTSAADVPT
ncbi:hypothetical protein HK098_007209, partial [Nowakowskiella sp. JEL0407]